MSGRPIVVRHQGELALLTARLKTRAKVILESGAFVLTEDMVGVHPLRFAARDARVLIRGDVGLLARRSCVYLDGGGNVSVGEGTIVCATGGAQVDLMDDARGYVIGDCYVYMHDEANLHAGGHVNVELFGRSRVVCGRDVTVFPEDQRVTRVDDERDIEIAIASYRTQWFDE